MLYVNQNLAALMVHKTLFYLSKFNKLHTCGLYRSFNTRSVQAAEQLNWKASHLSGIPFFRFLKLHRLKLAKQINYMYM